MDFNIFCKLDELVANYTPSYMFGNNTEDLCLQLIADITEEHKEEYVTILKDGLIVKTKQLPVEICVFHIEGDWNLLIRISEHIANNEKRYDTLSSLAQLLELPYKRGDDQIKIEVNEGRLLSTLKSIITKLCTC